MHLIEKTKKLLSLRSVSVIVILLSVAGRIIQKLSDLAIGVDKSYQIQGAKNLLAGHGISILEASPDNLSILYYAPLIKWPPGYSLFLSPFYASSGDKILNGTLWLDVLASLFFVLLARMIIQQTGIPKWLVNLYTLVAGFFLYEFFPADSSDLITLVFFQAAFLFLVKILRSDKPKTSHILLLTFFLFTCCLLRYMYLPVVFAMAAYLVVAGKLNANKIWIRRGLQVISSLIVLTGAMLLFQKSSGGSATYLYPTEKGIFPENILETAPFLFGAYANFALPAAIVQNAAGINENTMINFFLFANLALLVIFFFYSLNWIIKKRARATGIHTHFFYLIFLVTVTITGTLFYLSLTNASLDLTQLRRWTYVGEGRYFAAAVFLLQLWLVVGIYRAYKSGKLRRSMALLILTPLFLSTLHAVYYTSKAVAAGNREFFDREELTTLESCRKLFHSFVIDNAGKDIICSSGDPKFNNLASIWEGVPGLFDFEKLNASQLNVSRPAVVFVAVKDWYRDRLAGFLNNPAKKYIGTVKEWSFYSLDIDPIGK